VVDALHHLAKADLIERLCALHPEFRDLAAEFFHRYIHDAGTQNPMGYLMDLCGITEDSESTQYVR
jgi:hypothetical protein